MSIDDSGANRVPHDPALDIPWGARDARGILEIWDWLTRKHPDADAEREADLEAAAADMCTRGLTCQVPRQLLCALRSHDARQLRERHRITVHGIPVFIIVAQHLPKRLTPARALEIWEGLQHAVTDIEDAQATPCSGYLLHPDMPAEIAIASWVRDGTAIYACRPGSGGLLRATRRRLGSIAVIAPIPLLAAGFNKLSPIVGAPLAQAAGAAGAVATVSVMAVTALPVVPPAGPPSVVQTEEADLNEPVTAPSGGTPATRPSPMLSSEAPAPTRTPQRPPRDIGTPRPAPRPASPEPGPGEAPTTSPDPETPRLPAIPALPSVRLPTIPTPHNTSSSAERGHPVPRTRHSHRPGWPIGRLPGGLIG